VEIKKVNPELNVGKGTAANQTVVCDSLLTLSRVKQMVTMNELVIKEK
jgi:hypothetical protein